MWVAAAILIIISAQSIFVAGRSIRQLMARPNTPAWVLSRKLAGADLTTKTAIIGTLAERFRNGRAGRPGRATTVRIVKDILAEQIAPGRPWPFEYGRFVGEARRAGLVPDDLWEQFLANSIRVTVNLPATAHLNSLPIKDGPEFRGERSAIHLHVAAEFTMSEFYLNGGSMPLPTTFNTGGDAIIGGGQREYRVPLSVPAGTYDAVLVHKLTLRAIEPGDPTPPQIGVGRLVSETSHRHRWTLTIPGQGGSVATALHGTDLGASMKRAISIPLFLMWRPPNPADGGGRVTAGSYVAFNNLPAPICATVVLREHAQGETPLPSREWRTNESVIFNKGISGSVDLRIRDALVGFDATHVDIMLVPTPHLLNGNANITEFCGETIIIENVPVERSE